LSSPRSRLGKSAEIAAAAELGKRGYRIVDSNYHVRGGEIDLIAYDGDTLVFVEVRARSSFGFGTPADTVSRTKRAKIVHTAENYLFQKNLEPNGIRFDVVEVEIRDGKPVVLDVLCGAFDAEG